MQHNRIRRSIGIGLTGAALTAGSLLATTPAQAAGSTTCTGTISNRNIRGDLYVPAGKACQLQRVTVSGTTTVDGNLLAGGSTFKRDVNVRQNAYFNAWQSEVGGNVSFDDAWGGYLDHLEIWGSVSSPFKKSMVNLVTTGDTRVHGNYDQTYYDAVIGGFRVDGNLTASGYFGSVWVHDVQVGGDVGLSAHGGAGLTRALVKGNTGLGARYGTSVEDSTLNNVVMAALAGDFNRNTVHGTAQADSHMYLSCSGNTFYGQVLGAFATCTSAAAAKSGGSGPGTEKKIREGEAKAKSAHAAKIAEVRRQLVRG